MPDLPPVHLRQFDEPGRITGDRLSDLDYALQSVSDDLVAALDAYDEIHLAAGRLYALRWDPNSADVETEQYRAHAAIAALRAALDRLSKVVR